MWQPRCNIIDKESHPTCSNKAQWCVTSLCSKTSWKWRYYSMKNMVANVLTKELSKKWPNKLITMFILKTS
jgi:hypothetical protein